ncbi:MAG: NUDIX hydrolase [Acidimicrobiales bacterium]
MRGNDPDSAAASFEVEAAGGVVIDDGRVLVVHRPRYDDWSLPKGKLDPGETHEQAALREVAEETGHVCALGRRIGDITYTDHRGRSKRVRYWVMTATDGGTGFVPNDEVDELAWVGVESAYALLSYERDRAVLRRALASRPHLPPTGDGDS